MNKVALYGKHPKQKYYRLLTIMLDKRAVAAQGRRLREARAVESWFTKEFAPGENIPGRYTLVPLKHNQKAGK